MSLYTFAVSVKMQPFFPKCKGGFQQSSGFDTFEKSPSFMCSPNTHHCADKNDILPRYMFVCTTFETLGIEVGMIRKGHCHRGAVRTHSYPIASGFPCSEHTFYKYIIIELVRNVMQTPINSSTNVNIRVKYDQENGKTHICDFQTSKAFPSTLRATLSATTLSALLISVPLLHRSQQPSTSASSFPITNTSQAAFS